ncbi:hypothetical protein AVEN_244803-1 [Araneus ventricosus]|uniref:Uncharacterized protein n=1 Tax=Araneus ventricosus TaxID=182803 RepID=A0A4Y2VJ94_ARAVE|nr:hypothetical protein AVEN_244803-1 [Araneus ventricosus]
MPVCECCNSTAEQTRRLAFGMRPLHPNYKSPSNPVPNPSTESLSFHVHAIIQNCNALDGWNSLCCLDTKIEDPCGILDLVQNAYLIFFIKLQF